MPDSQHRTKDLVATLPRASGAGGSAICLLSAAASWALCPHCRYTECAKRPRNRDIRRVCVRGTAIAAARRQRGESCRQAASSLPERLIASSNLVGCSTGRSAGLAPLSILSTKTAARRQMSSRSYAIRPPTSTQSRRSGEGQSRDIATGPREAGHKSVADRVAHHGHNDRDRSGRLLCSPRHGRIRRDQFARQPGEPLDPPVCGSVLNGDVLALGIAPLAQSFRERRRGVTASREIQGNPSAPNLSATPSPPAAPPRRAARREMLVDPSVQSRTLMRLRLRGQASGHFAPAPPKPASEPAEQPSHLAWHSGNTAGFPVRGLDRLEIRRRTVVCARRPIPEVGQASAARSEAPHERR